nr:hypothetical protein pPsy0462b_00069 [Pseudomonas syringae]
MSYRPQSDPWFSRKVLKFHIAKNTFAVFSRYGGLGLYGLPPLGMSPEILVSMIAGHCCRT